MKNVFDLDQPIVHQRPVAITDKEGLTTFMQFLRPERVKSIKVVILDEGEDCEVRTYYQSKIVKTDD